MPDEIEATTATLRLLADSIWAVLQVADEMQLPDERAIEMANGYLIEMRDFLNGSALVSGWDVPEGACREDFDAIVSLLREIADAVEM